jgi:hypothetical protein
MQEWDKGKFVSTICGRVELLISRQNSHSPQRGRVFSRYLLGLFSHRRVDGLWKGMLQVRLENVADDLAATAALAPAPVGGAIP